MDGGLSSRQRADGAELTNSHVMSMRPCCHVVDREASHIEVWAGSCTPTAHAQFLGQAHH